jgi:hypothetical protein
MAAVITLRGESADYLKIGRGIAPGIVVSIKVKRAHDIDKKKGGGTTGTTITTNGERAIEVEITLRFWDDDEPNVHDAELGGASHLENELQRVQFLIDGLFPGGNKKPEPFDVAHPILALHHITSLFFESFDGPTQESPGVWTITLRATHFQPPKPKPVSVTGTPTTSKGPTKTKGAGAVAPPISNDDAAAAMKFAQEHAAWELRNSLYQSSLNNAGNGKNAEGFFPPPGPEPKFPGDPASNAPKP